MLSDRSYMRGDARQSRPGFLVWFLGALAAVFVLQKVAEVFFGSNALIEHGALSSRALRQGEIWTLLTYALLHGGPAHLLLNGLAIFFIGRSLQETLGSVRLAWLTAAGALGGAVLWTALHINRPGVVIGASGIAMTYLAYFACLNPRRPMTLLLFFIIPLTIQPIWLVGILGAVDLFGLLTQELPGTGSLYGVAHSAHLGGLVAGWLFYKIVQARGATRFAPSIEPPAWARAKSTRPAPAYTVNLGPATPAPSSPAGAATVSRDALRAEVDRILDKINLHGFGSLSEAEKRVLDEARQHLSHR